MSGFCPHDWHGTTSEDVYQMWAGEDYDFWADVDATERRLRKRRIDARECDGCGGESYIESPSRDGGHDRDPCPKCCDPAHPDANGGDHGKK